jgi:hypothetical protein
MTVNLSALAGAGQQFFTDAGIPLSGGKLYSYAAGTTTPQTTYTTAAGDVAQTNPIILDSAGRISGGEIWLTAGLSYKFILKNSSDVLIGTYDNIFGVNDFTVAKADIYAALASTTDNSKGDALIGFKQSNSSGFLTGATGKTVNTKFQEYISVKDFGAVGDGTTNDTTAMQAAITAVATTGQSLYVPSGTYKITAALTSTGHLNMFGDGDTSVISFSTATLSGSGLTVSGSITAIQNITSASKNSSTVTFASSPSLVAGDVFCLSSTDVWNAARAYYYAGEWCECRGTSGTAAYLSNPLYDSYTAAHVTVYKLSSKAVSFKNLRFVGGANTFGLVSIQFCDKPTLENVSAYNENYQGIQFDRCYRPWITNCNFYNKGTGTLDDYGLVIGNSQKVKINGGDFYSRRHGIAIGGGDYPCAVTNRDVKISNATISNDVTSLVYAADIHGNCQDVIYQGCTIYQGGGLGGADVGYDNCIIYSDGNGIVMYASEVLGGELFVRNSKLYAATDASSVSRGIMDYGGNGGCITSATTQTLSVIIENCYLYGTNLTSGSDFAKVVNNGSTANVNIYIDGIRANVNTIGCVLRTKTNSGTANSQAIVVDNISNFPTGVYLHLAQDASYLNKPHRLIGQTGSLLMTATSGTKTSILVGTQAFKYLYPRVPQCSVSLGSNTTGFVNSAGENIGATVYQLTESGIRPALVSTSNANWTATADMTINWLIALQEV